MRGALALALSRMSNWRCHLAFIGRFYPQNHSSLVQGAGLAWESWHSARMRYALIFSFALLAACGQPASSSAETSQVNPALVEPPIEDVEDLSGKKIVYTSSHPFGAEVFEASGKWSTDISMRGPLYLYGSWRQVGLNICVEIQEGSWKHRIVGETVCREIQTRPEGLFIRPMTEERDGMELQFTVLPID